ncbi:hypothetical protein TNCV_1651031 [Trichonephila clavipes]|nr:hypothetical protein TNCV_1651031 [Trichonephila clavipes]
MVHRSIKLPLLATLLNFLLPQYTLTLAYSSSTAFGGLKVYSPFPNCYVTQTTPVRILALSVVIRASCSQVLLQF